MHGLLWLERACSYNECMASVHSTVESVSGGDFCFQVPGSVYSPEEFKSDERLMIDTASQFMRGEVMPVLERLDKQEDGLMPGLIKKACDLGLGGPDTPEKFGGLGLSKCLATRILEMLSLNGSFSTTIGVHQGVGQTPIVMFGTEIQKEKYLPPLTSGEYMAAYALSEPNSGSDALSATTKAMKDSNGNWILNGTKMWISNAKWAGSFITFAKIDGEKFTAFLVERDFPGVSISREEHKMGLKGSSTARLILENAVVPSENVLYHEGQGHKVAFNGLNIGRCKLAGMALGQARESISVGTKYAKDRKQFNRPISEFGLIRDKISKSAALFFAAESMLYRTAHLIDLAFEKFVIGENLIEENRAAAEEFQIECSMVKVFATETLCLCVDEALQIHGGYGFTEEFPIARMYRDARVMRIYEGTNEINRAFIFDRIVKRGLVEKIVGVDAENEVQKFFIEGVKIASGADSKARDFQQILACASDLAIAHYAVQSSDARAKRLVDTGHAYSSFAKDAAAAYEAHATVWAAARLAELKSRCGVGGSIELIPGSFAVGDKLTDTIFETDSYPL